MKTINNNFKFTPKPRELTDEEIDKYDLRYSDGPIKKPAIEASTVIWASQMTETDPIYRLYDGGTNILIVLVYNWDTDTWDKIEYDEINNLPGLLWLMCLQCTM